jgi:iron complex transport system substrate-binding protein
MTLIRVTGLLLMIITGFSCRKPQNTIPDQNTMTVTDSYQRKVVITKNPQRIISLSPSITEILFRLGRGDRLAGRTDYCDFPPDTKNIPSVGSIMSPNVEAIAALKPDLIFGSDHFQKETLTLLENLHLPVYVGVLKNDYNELYRIIRVIGEITDTGSEAEEIIRQMIAGMESVRLKTAGLKQPLVYYMISYGDEGDFTAGKNTYIAHLIRTAGAVNAGDEIEGWLFSRERLLALDPDIILCGRLFDTRDRMITSPVYSRLKAVKTGRVYEIDQNLLDRIGYRNLEALESMVSLFHPELTGD